MVWTWLTSTPACVLVSTLAFKATWQECCAICGTCGWPPTGALQCATGISSAEVNGAPQQAALQQRLAARPNALHTALQQLPCGRG